MKRLILILFLIPLIGFGQTKIRNTQITSGSQPGNKVMKSDGATNVNWGNDSLTVKVPFVEFTEGSIPTFSNYKLFADTTNKTLAFYNDESEITMQVGQEMWSRVYNTGDLKLNGKVVRISGSFNEVGSISLASNVIHSAATGILGVATHDIETNTYGFVTTIGEVRGLNTSLCPVGMPIYLGVDGAITHERPAIPAFVIQIGTCIYSHATDGKILVNINGRPQDIIENAFNGSFIEGMKFTVLSNGTTITGSLQLAGGGDLTMMFSDGFTTLDCTPAKTVTITPGTSTAPQTNYVYVLKSTKDITVSTSGWPTDEHIKISEVVARTAAITLSDGILRNQNWNDHIAGSNGIGHLMHVNERVRRIPADWYSGIELSVNIVSGVDPDNVYLSTTGGKVYQMHLQDFPSQSLPTDDIHIVNHFTSPYVTRTNLNTILTDAINGTLANRSFSFVIWGIQNETGENSHLMLNLPIGSYSSGDLATQDALNYSVYTIPAQFRGVGFLIARVTFSHSPSGSGTWTLNQIQDLRGYIPNSTAGGGASGGGGGITSYLGLTDTPNSYAASANKLQGVNDAETAIESKGVTATLAGTVNIPTGQTYQINGSPLAATNIVNVPAVTIAATNVQTAINELSGDISTIQSTVATETISGGIKVATTVETLTGTDDTKAVTPLKLVDYIKVNALTYNEANQNINLGTYNLTGDTINAISKLQINGVNVRNDWVSDAIADGVTTVAPSQNAVFDALALKLPVNNPTATGLLTTPNLKVTSFTNADYVLKTNADGTIYSAALAASQVYKGTWNATTNTPTLANGTGTQGWYYRVVVAGTVNFGAGNITFNVGDDVSYNGSIWERIPAATIMGNPLTKTDDTNVTLTLGGSPATALVNAASIAVGWTGTLADSRITNSGNWNTAYNDKVNSLSVTGTTTKTITLTQQDGGTVAGNFTDEVNDADAYPTNELQDLSGSGATLSGYVISLSSDATTVTLPNEADGSVTNEKNTSMSWNDGTNTVSVVDPQGTVSAIITGFIETETDPKFALDSAYLKSHVRTDLDKSATNEIQDLSLTGNTLSLSSDPSTVDLSGYVNPSTANLTATDTKITVTNGTGAVIGTGTTIAVNEANLVLSNIGGAVTDSQVPNTITLDNITQITNRSHTNLSDIGTNTHAQIDTHITNDGDLLNDNEIQGLDYSAGTRTLDIRLTTDDVVLPLADGTNAGLMSNTHYTKLEGIASGAEVNVNSDWDAVSGDALILNKPTFEVPLTFSTGLLRTGNTITNTVTQFTNANETDPKFALDSAYLKSHVRTDLDKSATNELQTLSTTGAAGNISLSNSGGTLNLNVNDHTNRSALDLVSGTNTGDQSLSGLGGQPLLSFSETIVSTAGVVAYVLPFTLKSTTFVWFNGTLLKQSNWSGVGTTTLTLLVNTEIYDTIKIQN